MRRDKSRRESVKLTPHYYVMNVFSNLMKDGFKKQKQAHVLSACGAFFVHCARSLPLNMGDPQAIQAIGPRVYQVG